MVAPRNPLNLGAAARAMSNFGFLHLRVVNPYHIAFREARSAVGASAVLINAEEYRSVAEAVADCELVVGTTAVGHRELHHPLHRLEGGARQLRSGLKGGRVALLFGTEMFGLSNQDMSYCHWLIRIATREAHMSMNLGQAVAVCLYELMRDPKAGPRVVKSKAASAKEVERMTGLLFDALQLSGYVNPRAVPATEEKLRRLLRRMKLEPKDAQLWQGMLRQVVWKLRSEKT